MLTCLVPVLFTFYILAGLKLKKNNSGAKGLTSSPPSFNKSLYLFTGFPQMSNGLDTAASNIPDCFNSFLGFCCIAFRSWTIHTCFVAFPLLLYHLSIFVILCTMFSTSSVMITDVSKWQWTPISLKLCNEPRTSPVPHFPSHILRRYKQNCWPIS